MRMTRLRSAISTAVIRGTKKALGIGLQVQHFHSSLSDLTFHLRPFPVSISLTFAS
jgi:hypothetical protein